MIQNSRNSSSLLERAIKNLQDLLTSRTVPPEPPEELVEVEGFAQLYSTLMEVRTAIMAFASGDLTYQVKKKGYVPGSIKALQASLHHLIWQTKMIAAGDFSQRVDFMGDFSESFNSMVKQLEKKAKLEAQNRQLQKTESLSRMAGAIAHNFNNLLAAVMGNLELAALGLSQEAKAQEKIAQAMVASRRAADISRLMLAYLGQSMSERTPIGLSDICRETLPRITESLPEKVHLKMVLPDEGLTIRADAVQIGQILTNLVLNAGEAMVDREGEVTVAVQVIPAADIRATRFFPPEWEPRDENYACIMVSDTGTGMDNETVEKAFDPFFSTKFTGRGLGLAVVLGIVRAHEGALTVESTTGRGSAFRVFLPLSAQEVRPTQKASIAVNKGAL